MYIAGVHCNNPGMQALTGQPVSVYLDASARDFQLYGGTGAPQVYVGPCSSQVADRDHAVTVTGYTAKTQSTPQGLIAISGGMWNIRNQRGTGWGYGVRDSLCSTTACA